MEIHCLALAFCQEEVMDIAFDEQHRRKEAEVPAEFCKFGDRHHTIGCRVRELSEDPREHLPVGHFPVKEPAHTLAVGNAMHRRHPTHYRDELLRCHAIVAVCYKALLVTVGATTAASTVASG